MKDVLTNVDICAELRVSLDTFKLWLRSGKFPPADVKQGVRKLWKRSTVDAALATFVRRPAAV